MTALAGEARACRASFPHCLYRARGSCALLHPFVGNPSVSLLKHEIKYFLPLLSLTTTFSYDLYCYFRICCTTRIVRHTCTKSNGRRQRFVFLVEGERNYWEHKTWKKIGINVINADPYDLAQQLMIESVA